METNLEARKETRICARQKGMFVVQIIEGLAAIKLSFHSIFSWNGKKHGNR